MAADLTLVTELGTALGMLGFVDPVDALAALPGQFVGVTPQAWAQLRAAAGERHRHAFAAALANGRAFLAAQDGLRDRPPIRIEWKGPQRSAGDESIPADLRVDHVYLVSCKYLSSNIQSPSPARLFDLLLAPTAGRRTSGDWYLEVAPEPYRAFYTACRDATGLGHLPPDPAEVTKADRLALKTALPDRQLPEPLREAYREFCLAVSHASAERWSAALAQTGDGERMLWRLLRVATAPYFVLGTEGSRQLRLRVDTPWDWRQRFRFEGLTIVAARAGQPQVNWEGHYTRLADGSAQTVEGHVEIRWSHGRFANPPEAKVYLDTPHHDVPGYVLLDDSSEPDPARPQLF